MGVSFVKNVSLQVRNPVSLTQAGSYSKLSIYFRTKDSNGLLAYIGPDRTSRGMLVSALAHAFIYLVIVYICVSEYTF